MFPVEQHAAVLSALAELEGAFSVADLSNVSTRLRAGLADSLASRHRRLEWHAPEMVEQYDAAHVPQCETCARKCHSHSGIMCDQPVDGLWPCDEYRDAAAGLGVELPPAEEPA